MPFVDFFELFSVLLNHEEIWRHLHTIQCPRKHSYDLTHASSLSARRRSGRENIETGSTGEEEHLSENVLSSACEEHVKGSFSQPLFWLYPAKLATSVWGMIGR